jgi:NDP-sugar pyrophosphorylase family protein
MKPDLLIMAAGMGSRYGGLKQIDSIGPSGETIIDYSIYDAIRAGFGRVVFIIREEIEDAFKESVGNKYTDKIAVEYAFQELVKLPDGYNLPAERTKPWGTGHAILMAKDIIDKPFGVINADDFYGAETLKTLAGFLSAPPADNEYCMVGFKLANTLSKHGTVTRGICTTNENDILKTVIEVDGISPMPITSDIGPLTGDEIASMNIWGFTPSLFNHLETQFAAFLDQNINTEKAEFFIPSVVSNLVDNQKASVKVLKSSATWLGITYQDDKQGVVDDIQTLIDNGSYPSPLW